MPTKTRRAPAPVFARDLTAPQRKRKMLLFHAGKNQLDVANEIAKDGKSCTRQAVEALMMDRMPPSARMVEGFCKAIGYDKPPRYLFPGYKAAK